MDLWDEGTREGLFSSSTSSSGSDVAGSPVSTASSLVDFPSPPAAVKSRSRPSNTTASLKHSLKLELANIQLGLSATTSRESLLDELLGDIRRSCSLASTPTVVSQSEGEGENVFDCKLRRSEAELRTLSKSRYS